jgi:hypothetical protein
MPPKHKSTKTKTAGFLLCDLVVQKNDEAMMRWGDDVTVRKNEGARKRWGDYLKPQVFSHVLCGS